MSDASLSVCPYCAFDPVPNSIIWSSVPPGITGTGSSISFNPSILSPGKRYCVTAVTDGYRADGLVNVFYVESIEPEVVSNLEELPDSDGDPKTRVFVVPSSDALSISSSERFVVSAKTAPSLEPFEVNPCDGLSLDGGGCLGRLQEYVSLTGACKTVFRCSIGGVDTGLKTTVYVYDATVGLYSDGTIITSISPVGHAWGRLRIDDVTRSELVDIQYWPYIDYVGFFPMAGSWPDITADQPGDVRLGPGAYGSHTATGGREFHVNVKFSQLINALDEVRWEDIAPTDYNLFAHNCTHFAIWFGSLMSVISADPLNNGFIDNPHAFADWLNDPTNF